MARPIEAEKFVEIWNSSSTRGEAAKRAKCSLDTATVRACRLRRRGVPMRHFGRGKGNKLDVERLKQIAEAALR